MLDTFRKNVRRLSWTLWLVIVAFIILYIPDLVSGGAGNVVARVDGEPIMATELQQAVNDQLNLYRSMNEGQLPDDFIQQMQLERVVLEQLIRRRLILAAARDQGFAVAPQEIKDRIMEYPVFRDAEGRWVGDEQYLSLLRRNNLEPAAFEQSIREDILADRLTGLLTEGVSVSDAELRDLYARQNEKVSLEFVQVRPGAFQMEVGDGITDEELSARYDAAPDAYRMPEQRRVSYALIDTEAMRETVTVDEAALRAAFDASIQDYTIEEQIKARQILVRVPPGADDAAKGPLRGRADEALARLRAGEDFAAVAAAVSDDPSSAAGGDLGWVSRGLQVEGFDEVAFALPVGGTSEVFETVFGFHIVRVDERRDESVQPFEEVRGQLEQRLAWERAEADAQAAADRVRRAVLSGSALDVIAESEGLQVEQSPLFTKDTGFASFTSPEFTDRAFTLGSGRVAEPVRVRRGHIVFRVDEIVDAHTPPLADVKERVRQDVITQRAAERAAQVASGYVERLRAGEPMETIASEVSTTVETAADLDRDGLVPALGRSPLLMEKAFALDSGAVGEPVEVNDRQVVFRVTAHARPDWALFEEQEQTLREQETGQRRNRLFEAYVQALRERYTVVIYDDVLDRNAI